jgi:acyl carrier protein
VNTRPTLDRLYQVTEGTFGVSQEALSDDASPLTLAAWDSLGHLNLILAIETEFGVSFSPEDVIALRSLGAIRRAWRARGVDA